MTTHFVLRPSQGDSDMCAETRLEPVRFSFDALKSKPHTF